VKLGMTFSIFQNRGINPFQVQASQAPHKTIQRTPSLGMGTNKCACGGGAGIAGECEDCRKKKLTGDRGGFGGYIHHGGGFGGGSDTPIQTPEVVNNPNPVSVDQPVQLTGGVTAPLPVCDPDRALTWADFTGTPPQSDHSARTSYSFPKDATSNPIKFRAVLDSPNSWVKPGWKNPTVQANTPAQALINQCKTDLRAHPDNSWALDDTPDAKCPASPTYDSSIEATTVAECDSKIGPETDRVAGLESTRLLAHEQLHFTIACTLVKKANASIAAGKSVSDIETKLSQTDSTVTNSYDTESDHGCKSAEQTTWNNKVANGLPDIKIE